MAKTFKNWKELEKHIEKNITDILNKEMTRMVKDELVTAIDEDIYQSGTPTQYPRRAGNDYGGMREPDGTGSIADRNTMISTIKNGMLTVTPEAERNSGFNRYAGAGYDTSKSLAYNLINGYGNEWFSRPRNFIKTTYGNILSNKLHLETMTEGLQDRGFKVVK